MKPTKTKPTALDETATGARDAAQADLQYVRDTMPGITRVRSRGAFRYRHPDGRPVHDAAILSHIKALAIPPAWTHVWICPSPHGHLQATGRDARGRKQHRYHARWRQVRDKTKYDRMNAFGRALPRIRRHISRDLALTGLPREKVLATVVKLLETTLIRVGNEEYARHNGSFGLTTMRDRHAHVSGNRLSFEFRGKSGIKHEVQVNDRRLARIVKRCQDLPGQELFQYVDDDGRRQSVDSADVNAYIRSAAGGEFTAKDFRTWAGTVLAALALQEFQGVDSEAQAKRNILQAVESVAQRLGNTRTVCRKCYIHPAVIDAYLDGSLLKTLAGRAENELKRLRTMRPEEAAVLVLLKQRLKKETKAGG